MANRKNVKNKGENYRYRGNNTRTQKEPLKSISSSIGKIEDVSYGNNMIETFHLIFNLTQRVENLEKENKQIVNQLQKIKNRENRLLNRFGWTLIMSNILLGVFTIIMILVYFQFMYPFLQKIIKNSSIEQLIFEVSVAIIIFLAGVWSSLVRFSNYIRKRDQDTKER